MTLVMVICIEPSIEVDPKRVMKERCMEPPRLHLVTRATLGWTNVVGLLGSVTDASV